MRLEDFGPYTLSTGCHSGPDVGMCLMEMVSFVAGDEWSDMPECASPVLSRFCQGINDRFEQAERDQLQQFVPMLVGTRSPEHEQARAEVLAWGAVRKFAPFWLRKAGQHADADRLASFSGTMEEAKAAADAANAAAAAAAAAMVFPLVLEVLREAIEAGPHGTAYTDIHLQRGAELARVMEAQS